MNLNKIALLRHLFIGGIVFSGMVTPVHAANIFSIEYFDYSNNLVGSGKFTDSESVPTCFQTTQIPAYGGGAWCFSWNRVLPYTYSK